MNSFINKYSNKKIIAVQGLGFVGSVMSLVCANAIKGDYAVIGVDLPTKHGKKIINDLNTGTFPLVSEDSKIEQFYQNTIVKGNFLATYDEQAFKYANVIIVDVNLDVNKNNDNSGILNDFNVDLDSF